MLERKVICPECGEDYPPSWPHNCEASSVSPAGYDSEHLHNVRRTLEHGLQIAETAPIDCVYIDLMTHALNELKRSGLEFPES